MKHPSQFKQATDLGVDLIEMRTSVQTIARGIVDCPKNMTQDDWERIYNLADAIQKICEASLAKLS